MINYENRHEMRLKPLPPPLLSRMISAMLDWVFPNREKTGVSPIEEKFRVVCTCGTARKFTRCDFIGGPEMTSGILKCKHCFKLSLIFL